jgi:hypothetical protein
MGRNKLPDHLRKQRHTFRLSNTAKTVLKEMAHRKGKSMSQLLEAFILEKTYDIMPDKLT